MIGVPAIVAQKAPDNRRIIDGNVDVAVIVEISGCQGRGLLWGAGSPDPRV